MFHSRRIPIQFQFAFWLLGVALLVFVVSSLVFVAVHDVRKEARPKHFSSHACTKSQREPNPPTLVRRGGAQRESTCQDVLCFSKPALT